MTVRWNAQASGPSRRPVRRSPLARTGSFQPHDISAWLAPLREELEIERSAVEAEHLALAEAQRALESTRRDYEDTYGFGLVGVATFDLLGCVKHVNPTGAALLERSVLNLLGRPLVAVIAPGDRRKWFGYLRRLRREKSPVRIELRIRKAGGRLTLLEFASVCAPSLNESAGCIRTAFRDVTEQRRAEEEALSAQTQLRFVTDNAPVMIARCSRDLTYRFVNRPCAEMLQLPPSSIIGRKIVDVLGRAAFKVIRPYIDRVLRGESVEFDVQVPYPRSGLRYVHVAYRPEWDERHQVSGWLSAISDLTALKRAESAVQESEVRFRVMADGAPVLMWIAGVDKGCTYFNKPWLEFTGRTMQEELGLGWAESVHPEDRDRCVESYVQAFDRREEFQLEYRLRRHDGQYRWLLDHGVPRYSGQEFVGYIGSCVDITHHKQTEAELREARDVLEQRVRDRTAELRAEVRIRRRAEQANARLAAIVESSTDAIASYSLSGIVVSWNKGAERLYGYRAREVIGRPASALQPLDRRREFLLAVKRIRRGEVVKPFETVRLAKGGHPIDVFIQLSPIRNEAGRVIGISHVARDISARKLVEAALRESESRLQAITDNCPALIFLKDRCGRYLHFNRRFSEVFQVQLGQAVGRTDAQIFRPKQAAAFRAGDLKVLETRAPVVFEEVTDYEDGPHINVVAKFPLFDAHGEIYAVGGVVTDVTERRRLEEEILQISEREQRRIAQDLHDGLGQQLAGICCLGDVLRKSLVRSGSPESGKATRISRLLHATVAETRGLARGLHPVEDEPHGLMSALRALSENISTLFKIDCRFRCPAPVPLARNAAATHLYRIAQEAVTNAIRHGRSRHVEIGLTANIRRISLTIRDDGIGLSARPRRPKGVGLRIMDYRAQMVGGTVKVQRRRNRGTEVLCVIPKQD